MKMYCLTLDDGHYDKIKYLDYIPVGLGSNIKNPNFLGDKNGDNISEKNSFYGEYTFHYWLWKNEIKNIKKEWVGFCQYRKFWTLNNKNIEYKNIDDLKKNIFKDIPEEYKNFESILGEPFYVNRFKLSKIIKKGFKKIIKDPTLIFNDKKRNIKFHFDIMHGDGNLDKAISLLENDDKKDFADFVNTKVSFNPHNMFICKSSIILEKYYSSIFPWLKRCEKEFGFDLKGYGLKRIYGFLAERYMSYWFKKYTKFKTLPIIFQDISELD